LNNHSKTRPAVIIFNPLAGRGKSAHYAAQAKKKLEQLGWLVHDCIKTEYAGHTETKLAKEWGPRVDLIVLVGGDGTLRELVSGLRAANLNTEIAFIPMGNANVVARELNIPLQPNAAIALLESAHTRKVDICILKQARNNDLVFLAMLEIGFGAKIVHLVNQLRNGSLKTLYRFWGDAVYAIAGILALKGLGKDLFDIKLGEPNVKSTTSHCVIANMQTYAKDWSLTPDAQCDDGIFDVATSNKANTWATIRTLIAASQKRKLKTSLMTYHQATEVEISGKPSLFVQVDGDPVNFSGEAKVCIEKQAFTIRVDATKK